MPSTPSRVKGGVQVNPANVQPETQVDGQISALQDGGYFITWTRNFGAEGHGGINSTSSIEGQRFDSAANPVGGEVLIAGGGELAPTFSSAETTLANGKVAIASIHLDNDNPLFRPYSLFVKLFDPTNNSVTSGPGIAIRDSGASIADPAITGFADSSYVVSFTSSTAQGSHSIFANVVSAAGTVGSAFNIANNADDSQLVTLSNGNFVATYQAGSTGNTDIAFRLYSPTGTAQSPSTPVVGGNGSAAETDPDVAALSNGFVVVWTDADTTTTDIRATIYSDTGSVVASNILINSNTPGAQDHPSVIALADGGFVASWDDENTSSVEGQRFDAVGHPIGSEFTIQAAVGSPESATLKGGNEFAYALDSSTNVFTQLWSLTPHNPSSDFNGDGISDVLWRNDATGAVGFWPFKDGGITWNAVNGSGTDFKAVGIGDFNGDGTSDILWRNDAAGDVGWWEMHNGANTWHYIGGSGTDFKVVGIGDFNDDGTSDVLWRNNATGDVGWWEMHNATPAWHFIGGSGTDFKVVGIGKFNIDGTSDVLWRNDADGTVGFWPFKNGGITWDPINGSGTDFKVAGIGDFNGDGTSDILWRNDTTGDVGLWEMHNGVNAWHFIGSSGTDYKVATIGDFNGDGTSDVLWRNNATGDVGWWEMHNSAPTWHALAGSGTDFHVVT